MGRNSYLAQRKHLLGETPHHALGHVVDLLLEAESRNNAFFDQSVYRKWSVIRLSGVGVGGRISSMTYP